MDAFLKRFARRRWVMGTALALVLVGRGDAQVPGIPVTAPPNPPIVGQLLPDGETLTQTAPMTGVPETVVVPEGMNPYETPGPTLARPYRPSSPVLVNDQVWFSWYGSASRRAMLAPNMFGDLSGTRSIGFSPFSVAVTTAGTAGTLGTGGSRIGGTQLNAFIQDGGVRGIYTADLTTTLQPFVTAPTYLGASISTSPFQQQFTTTTSAGLAGFPATVPLVENAIVTAAIRTGLGLSIVFNPASQAVSTAPGTGTNIYNVQLVYDTSGTTTGGTAGTAGTASTTNILPVFTLFLPNPSGGGTVGRTKVATDNSPIPRDRLIADYDFVSGAPIVRGGMDFNRFCFGFEKTLFDGVSSVEMRVPFASTVNGSTDGTTTEGSHAELGNIALNFKMLLAGGEIYSLTTGVGVSVPTASDTRVRSGNVDAIKVINEALICTPYVAIGFTPTDRIFGQAWAGVGIDTTGNPVKLNTGSGLSQIGKLYDPYGLQVDAQLGFWLLHPATNKGVLRGLAPFGELHFNNTLSSAGVAQTGSFAIADSQGHFEETSLSTGFVAQIQDNVHLSTGVTVPLNNSSNRFGNYQLGVRLNWFFGATGEARSRAIPYY